MSSEDDALNDLARLLAVRATNTMMQVAREWYRKGEVVHTTSSRGYKVGHVLSLFRPSTRGFDLLHIVEVRPGELVLRRLGLLERFWFYVKQPRLWKYALDIPFTAPDIRVTP